MQKYNVLLISGLAAILASCASTTVPDPEPSVETDEAATSFDTYDGEGVGSGEAFADDATVELGTVIYFDLDQSDLKPEYVDMLARHAANLSDSTGILVRLEGHADERGSREYNVGLGERRSQAVRRILHAQGVSTDQLATISFGEERPVVPGTGEQSYAQNRRVEIKYLN